MSGSEVEWVLVKKRARALFDHLGVIPLACRLDRNLVDMQFVRRWSPPELRFDFALAFSPVLVMI